jgi:phospholipase C
VQYRAAGLLFFLLVAGGGIVACSGSPGASNGVMPPATHVARGSQTSPISHIIVVIQENRSFDDFFATFPHAHGATVGYAEAMSQDEQTYCAEEGQQVITYPTTVPLTEVSIQGAGFPTTPPSASNPGKEFGYNQDLAHTYASNCAYCTGGYLIECDSAATTPTSSNPCKMDGFDLTKFGPNGEGPAYTCTYTYQYVNPSVSASGNIAPYWSLAEQYVLADETFMTQGSESFTAHQDLIEGGTAGIVSGASIIDDPTGFPWGCDASSGALTSLITIYGQYEVNKGPRPCWNYPKGTIRDLLDGAGISWKYYANKVYPYTAGQKLAGGSGIWSAFDAVQDVRNSKEWGTKVTFKDTKIFSDIKAHRLPDVAWVTPDGVNSDHPAEHSDTGPSWVAQIVNAVGESKYWKSCAIVVLWDDWGGFYDNASPPLYDNQGGLGFRIPMIIISPYVQARVDHTQYETASVLRFIENNWNLGQLGQEDVRATPITDAFNFSQTPRPFQPISAKYSRSFFLNQKPSGIPPDSD